MRVHLEQEDTIEKQNYDKLKGEQIDLNDNAWNMAHKIVRRHYTEDDVAKAQYLQDKFENVDTIAKDSCFHFHYMGTKEDRDYDNNPIVKEAQIESHFDFRLNGSIDVDNNSSYARSDNEYGYALFRDELKAQDDCNPDILIEQEGKDNNPHLTKYKDANDKYLGDDDFRPFWGMVEELGAVVQIHPVPGLGGQTNKQYYLWNAFSNPAETALTASHMILSGLMEEHPELKIQLFHGGGHLPYQIGRLDRAYEMRLETSKKITMKPSEYLKMFYFDTIVHSCEALEYLINLVGAEQVMLGSDYPFDMGSYKLVDMVDKITKCLGQSP